MIWGIKVEDRGKYRWMKADREYMTGIFKHKVVLNVNKGVYVG